MQRKVSIDGAVSTWCYGPRGEVTHVVGGGGDVSEVVTNFRRQRVAEVWPVNGLREDFRVDESSRLLVEAGVASLLAQYPRPTREYVWLGMHPVAVIDSTEAADGAVTPKGVTYTFSGQLGEVLAETDSDGTVLRQYEYTPFGQRYELPPPASEETSVSMPIITQTVPMPTGPITMMMGRISVANPARAPEFVRPLESAAPLRWVARLRRSNRFRGERGGGCRSAARRITGRRTTPASGSPDVIWEPHEHARVGAKLVGRRHTKSGAPEFVRPLESAAPLRWVARLRRSNRFRGERGGGCRSAARRITGRRKTPASGSPDVIWEPHEHARVGAKLVGRRHTKSGALKLRFTDASMVGCTVTIREASTWLGRYTNIQLGDFTQWMPSTELQLDVSGCAGGGSTWAPQTSCGGVQPISRPPARVRVAPRSHPATRSLAFCAAR